MNELRKYFGFMGVYQNNHDMSKSASAVETSRIIQESNQACLELNSFLEDNINYEYVSLGQNCSSSWYLKQLGLKKKSYPFDWVFSSPEIISDCINNKFQRYMDKALIKPAKNGHSAKHLYYHENMFNHKNPLKNKGSYEYYQRCCERFLGLIESQRHTLFLITLVNEPDKRVDWAKGFTNNFSMPRNQGIESVEDMIRDIAILNDNAKFVVINHYTERDRSVCFKRVSENSCFIDFHSLGANTGVHFTNRLDDFCYKVVLSGLCK